VFVAGLREDADDDTHGSAGAEVAAIDSEHAHEH
jgi:hypothetical protein